MASEPKTNPNFQALLRIADLRQSRYDGMPQNCPCCGHAVLLSDLELNQKSRRAPAYICPDCAMAERRGAELELKDWVAVQPEFEILARPDPVPGAIESKDLVSGMDGWAWAYVWPAELRQPALNIRPVRGILSHSKTELDTENPPLWFAPYKAKPRNAPFWKKAIPLRRVNLHDNEQSAIQAYRSAVWDAIEQFKARVDQASDHLDGVGLWLDAYRYVTHGTEENQEVR